MIYNRPRRAKKIALGDLSVGSSVYMSFGGTRKEFIVVQQGLPDATLYDESCNGTWLMAKDVLWKAPWHRTSLSDYKASYIHSALNSDSYLSRFDSAVQAAIKRVKIPYASLEGNYVMRYGSNGLQTKLFLLSGYELGWTAEMAANYFPVDGACLSYFKGMSERDSGRIGYWSGSPTSWWTRSPMIRFTVQAISVAVVGDYISQDTSASAGIRPALIFPSDIEVDAKHDLIV